MEGNNIDSSAGGASEKDLKSQPGAGGSEGGADVTGLKSKINELLNESKGQKAELERFREAEKKRTEDEAKKRGDYETLIKAKDDELVKAKTENKKLRIRVEASAAGLIDPDYVDILSGKISDDFSNLADTLKELKEQKPYLFGEAQNPQIPATDKMKGGHQRPGKQHTGADVAAMSDAEYEAYRKEHADASRFGVFSNR